MIQTNETLYNEDKNGNVLQWSVFTDEDTILVQAGREGGKIKDTSTKSLAKQNTTAPEQAIKEALSKWKKQIKKGYVVDKAEIGTTVTLAPLAKKYQDSAKHVNWEEGSVCLTKYDGVRMTAFYRGGKAFFQSRGGESYPIIEEIAEELYKDFWQFNEYLVIDGELYEHGMYLEDISSAVKKHNEDTPRLKFYVFDLFNPVHKEEGYLDRLRTAETLLGGYGRLRIADWFLCHFEQLMLTHHDLMVADGFEGIILRDKNGLFKFNQRDVSFIKYKIRHRAEYVTVKPIECKNGSVKIRMKVTVNGEVKFFEPAMLGTIEHQRRLLTDEGWAKYNTGFGTIEYEAISKYGIPAKAKFVSFREVDSQGNPLV